MAEEKGTQSNPEEEIKIEEPIVEEPKVEETGTPPPEKVEEKLYAGKYKTVEELEEGYKNSQREVTTAVERAGLADRYEEILRPHQDKIIKGVDGRYILKVDATPKAETEEDLTDEELGAFSDEQIPVLNKLVTKITKANQDYLTRVFKDKEDRAHWWGEAVKEFPDMANVNSEFRKTAEDIARREYAQILPDGRVYVSPKANYDAAIKADRLLRKRQEEKTVAEKETEKTKEQNSFVVGKGGKGERKGKLSDEEFAKLSSPEQEKYLATSVGL